MKFIYEHIPTQEQVREHIKNCEGKHTQQAIYSTFHDALTQICFGCKKIRSTAEIELKDIVSVYYNKVRVKKFSNVQIVEL